MGEERTVEIGVLPVNRSRFLLLAGALAATGCGTTTTVVTGSDAGNGPGNDAGGTGSDAGATNEGGATAPDAGACPVAEGCQDAGTDAGACYGDVGTPGSCLLRDAGVLCAWQSTYCSSVAEGMRDGVAQAAVSCMEGLTDCNTSNAYTCAKLALNAACPDSTATAPCSTIEGACTGGANAITLPACHLLVDGLNAIGRQKVLNCISPDGGTACQFGLYSCIEGL